HRDLLSERRGSRERQQRCRRGGEGAVEHAGLPPLRSNWLSILLPPRQSQGNAATDRRTRLLRTKAPGSRPGSEAISTEARSRLPPTRGISARSGTARTVRRESGPRVRPPVLVPPFGP